MKKMEYFMNTKTTFLGLTIFSLIIILISAGCAAKRPVLYPNTHLNEVGQVAAQKDIDDCMKKANESVGKQNPGGKVAKQTVYDAAVGAATGAAAGAINSNAGIGAATGAAGGGAFGCITGIFGSKEPDPIFTQFVDQCLRDKGYEPIGWR